MNDSGALRLFALCGALAIGCVVAERTHPGAAVAMVCGALPLAVALGLSHKGKEVVFTLTIAALGLGFALAGVRLASVRGSALAAGARRGADAILTGEALEDQADANGAVRFAFGVQRAQIDGRAFAVRERVVVTVRPPPPFAIVAGDRLKLDARLGSLRLANMSASARDAATRLERHGIAARAYAPPDGVEPAGHTRNPISAIARAGRAAVRRASLHVPRGERALLLGVTIGDTSTLDPQVALDFRTTGLSHLVAVSGENVAMVLAVVAFLLRALRARRRVTVAVMCAATLAFCAIARFEPSVMRAGVMTAIALTGLALGARRNTLRVLAAATLALLVFDPFLAFEAGFQLSVLATVGIVVLGPRVRAMLPEGRLAHVAAITMGAQLAVAPLIAVSFHQLSLVSIAANIAVLPGVAPATVIGMIAAGLGALWHPLSALAIATTPAIAWMQAVAHVLAQLPLASVGTPTGVAGIALALVLAAGGIAIARGRGPRRAGAVVLALSMVMTGTVWARALGPRPLSGLIVTMIDVGQGDALLVRAGAHAMLIDGGPDPSLLLRALTQLGVHRLDLMVMTHPHADHVDGLVPLAQRFPIARALDPYFDDGLPAYLQWKDALARRGIPRDRALAGDTYQVGAAGIDVLWPPPVQIQGTAADINNNSIVLRVRYGTQTVLFAGEVQEEAQAELLKTPGLLRADVLKVSHHGSAHMLPAFYAATGARIALIPVGPNTFGHPAGQTLAALRGMRVLRSDRSGTVSVALDGAGGIEIREQRPQAAAA